MIRWQYLLVAAAALVLILAIRSAVGKRKLRIQRDFTRKLETLLQPKETVKVLCPQKKGTCILTSHRLIFEKKGNFTAIPLKTIQRVQGTNEAGNRTTSPNKMVSLTVKAEKDHIIYNTSEAFCELADQLIAKVKKQNEKKTGKANEKK